MTSEWAPAQDSTQSRFDLSFVNDNTQFFAGVSKGGRREILGSVDISRNLMIALSLLITLTY